MASEQSDFYERYIKQRYAKILWPFFMLRKERKRKRNQEREKKEWKEKRKIINDCKEKLISLNIV